MDDDNNNFDVIIGSNEREFWTDPSYNSVVIISSLFRPFSVPNILHNW